MCLLLSSAQVEDANGAVGCGGTYLVAPRVPADFKNAARTAEGVDQLARSGRPDVDPAVKGAGRDQFPVRAEGDGIYGLVVFGERVKTRAALHLPKPHRRIKGRRGEQQILVRVRRARSGRRPLDRVDFRLVRAQIV